VLEQCGPVDSIDALFTLPLLHDSATDGDGSDSDWRSWLDYHGRPDIDCRAGQHFSEASMLINAAVLGLGVALARASLVADHLASGALVCPLELVAPTAYTYYLTGLPEAADRPRIAMFRNLLIEEAAATETFTVSMGASMRSKIGLITAGG
jgi:LysR family glycine cleavage system transcriptional activator